MAEGIESLKTFWEHFDNEETYYKLLEYTERYYTRLSEQHGGSTPASLIIEARNRFEDGRRSYPNGQITEKHFLLHVAGYYGVIRSLVNHEYNDATTKPLWIDHDNISDYENDLSREHDQPDVAVTYESYQKAIRQEILKSKDSKRLMEVFNLLIEEVPKQIIAEKLGISRSTVSGNCTEIMSISVHVLENSNVEPSILRIAKSKLNRRQI